MDGLIIRTGITIGCFVMASQVTFSVPDLGATIIRTGVITFGVRSEDLSISLGSVVVMSAAPVASDGLKFLPARRG